MVYGIFLLAFRIKPDTKDCGELPNPPEYTWL
ncbi:MAG: hypothetical protein RLZZ146_1457 [Bacteroidota bacterium]